MRKHTIERFDAGNTILNKKRELIRSVVSTYLSAVERNFGLDDFERAKGADGVSNDFMKNVSLSGSWEMYMNKHRSVSLTFIGTTPPVRLHSKDLVNGIRGEHVEQIWRSLQGLMDELHRLFPWLDDELSFLYDQEEPVFLRAKK